MFCKFCKIEFFDKWYKKTREFCSKSCATKARGGFVNRKPRKKTGKNIACENCNKIFYVSNWRFVRYNPRFCSKSCLAKVHFEKYSHYRFQPLHQPKRKYKTITIKGKQIREHRWIMENHLGRKLENWEHVHHINGNSLDNRLENLIVLSNSEHQRVEQVERKKFIS